MCLTINSSSQLLVSQSIRGCEIAKIYKTDLYNPRPAIPTYKPLPQPKPETNQPNKQTNIIHPLNHYQLRQKNPPTTPIIPVICSLP